MLVLTVFSENIKSLLATSSSKSLSALWGQCPPALFMGIKALNMNQYYCLSRLNNLVILWQRVYTFVYEEYVQSIFDSTRLSFLVCNDLKGIFVILKGNFKFPPLQDFMFQCPVKIEYIWLLSLFFYDEKTRSWDHLFLKIKGFYCY